MHTEDTESDSEREYVDELERWMEQHLDDVENLHVLLHQLRHSKDGNRRKAGNVYHASLVKRFYERGGPLKVVGVECSDIEPNTDVDIRLSGETYIQVWHGKTPMGYTMDKRVSRGDGTPIPIDWDKELKLIEKKLLQLPSHTGKGFVLNIQPGLSSPPQSLHNLCSPNKCVMILQEETLYITLHGTADFMYLDEACKIARALGRPMRHILGDWNELSKHGRDPFTEASCGLNPSNPAFDEVYKIRNNRTKLLNYARDELKYEHWNKLKIRDGVDLFDHLFVVCMYKDSDCQYDGSLEELVPFGLRTPFGKLTHPDNFVAYVNGDALVPVHPVIGIFLDIWSFGRAVRRQMRNAVTGWFRS